MVYKGVVISQTCSSDLFLIIAIFVLISAHVPVGESGGRVSDSQARGPGFYPYSGHCVV